MSFSVQEQNIDHQISIRISGNTEEDVTAGVNQYLNSYHPYGYGTTFSKIQFDNSNGSYYSNGRRYHSCD